VTIIIILQSQINTNSGTSELFLTHHDINSGGDLKMSSSLKHQNSCSQNTLDTLSRFIAKINEDPHTNAMIDLEIPIDDDAAANSANNNINNDDDKNSTINDANNMRKAPGLHLSSFHGKRIALLGDSTLFYIAKYLGSMLVHQNANAGKEVEYHKMNMGQANSFVLANKQFMLKGTASPPPFKKDDNTWFQWYGMSGNAHTRTEELIDAMFRDAEKMRPEVVVANMAFHWFHLCGYNEKFCPTPMDSTIIARWLHYKETWLQRVYDFAVKVDAKVLLFKTANFICGTARSGDWATGDALYQSFDNATLLECQRRLEPLAKGLFLVPDDIRKYCKYGQFTDVGSRYLNEQMVEFVRGIDEQDGGVSEGRRLTVGLYNDHDVESCSTTDDAIHHKSGNVVRIRLLANTIDSYMKCSRS